MKNGKAKSFSCGEGTVKPLFDATPFENPARCGTIEMGFPQSEYGGRHGMNQEQDVSHVFFCGRSGSPFDRI